VKEAESKEWSKVYDPHRVEDRWYSFWEQKNFFRADENSRRPP